MQEFPAGLSECVHLNLSSKQTGITSLGSSSLHNVVLQLQSRILNFKNNTSCLHLELGNPYYLLDRYIMICLKFVTTAVHAWPSTGCIWVMCILPTCFWLETVYPSLTTLITADLYVLQKEPWINRARSCCIYEQLGFCSTSSTSSVSNYPES